MDRTYVIAIAFAGGILFELLFYGIALTRYERWDDPASQPRFPRKWFAALLIGTGTLAVILYSIALQLDSTQ